MKTILSLLYLLFSIFTFSQTKVKDTVTRRATIDFNQKANVVLFKPQTPPLVQIAGAPPANYSYFWEMGDGSYTKEASPKKVYKKKGNYKVNLMVTNNYDSGKPPTTRPKTVAIIEDSDEKGEEIAGIETSEGFKIFSNREPSPNEEMIVVISYQNLLDYVANGKIYLFYNENEFKNKNFQLLEIRNHFGEKVVTDRNYAFIDDKNDSKSNTASGVSFPIYKNDVITDEMNLDESLAESKLLFQDSSILEFDGMNPKETRNVFFNFKTTPEMLKDTSATVKIRGIYVPDRSYKNHKKRTLEMEIVTSHDPNKMSSNGRFINYRLVRYRTLDFKTRFQNDGEGPAKTIRLETDVPNMFDKKTLKIVDLYPKCAICPKGEIVSYSCLDTIIKKDQIYFTFKNIYLPGSNQKNVTQKDSTKGFVKYSLKFAKDFHKIKTKSKTSIFFDKNEPVITNYATTQFLPGISIGAKVGYNYYSGLNNAKSYFVAATISPFKSYRWYWQAELQASTKSYTGETAIDSPTTQGSTGLPVFTRDNIISEFAKKNIEIPVLMRYNINNFFGVGAGCQANIDVSGKESQTGTTTLYQIVKGTRDVYENLGSKPLEAKEINETTQKIHYGALIDFTAGFARIGPSLGVRYVMDFDKNFNYWQFYGIWKF